MKMLSLHIEALIFSSENPLSLSDIKNTLSHLIPNDTEDEEIQSCIDEIRVKYQADDFAFQLMESGGGYQFLTKSEFYPTLMHFMSQSNAKRLSTAALETLAIIAYKQPITKGHIEEIRGVNCDYSIQKLLEKELIAISGRSDGPGKPLQYSVSQHFLNHFGINSISDLPKLKELEPQQESSIGVAEPDSQEEHAHTESHHDIEEEPAA